MLQTMDAADRRMVASAALGRAVLLERAAVSITAAASGLLLVHDRWRVVGVIASVAASAGAEIPGGDPTAM
jgi:hypothetical protein